MSIVLSIKGVNKTFGGLQALGDINLDIEEGMTHAIIGPNGAGKSTLLNGGIGRLIPDSGTVDFVGKNMIGMQPHEINHAGMVRVFQTPEIFRCNRICFTFRFPLKFTVEFTFIDVESIVHNHREFRVFGIFRSRALYHLERDIFHLLFRFDTRVAEFDNRL